MVARFKEPPIAEPYRKLRQIFRLVRRQADRFLAMPEIKGHDVDSGLVDNFARVLIVEMQAILDIDRAALIAEGRRDSGDASYNVAAEAQLVMAQLQQLTQVVVAHHAGNPMQSLRYKADNSGELEQLPIDAGLRAKLLPELAALRDLIEPDI